MTISGFLKYVEIKTKITSVFSFAMIAGYLFSIGQPVDVQKTAVFFAGMFLFDLATTSINNYIDTKSNGLPLPVSRKSAAVITAFLLVASAGLGIGLVLMTDTIVLLVGALCFATGVLYTYGPLPISRQPWGELVSGLFYGLVIPFLILYINMPQGYYMTVSLNAETLSVELQILPILTVLLLAVSPVCCTANIMLANNICDLEKDVRVKRHTLPYYIGVPNALKLFAFIYYITYANTVLLVITRILHPIALLALITIVPVQKNINTFMSTQDKEETFPVSIANFIAIMSALVLVIWMGGFLTRMAV